MKVDTVSTIHTVDHVSFYRRVVWRVVVAHACPLPGIFFGVDKNYVVAFYISPTVHLVRVIGLRLHVFILENTAAIVMPKCH